MLKEAKNAQKRPFWAKNVIFQRFKPLSKFHFLTFTTLGMTHHYTNYKYLPAIALAFNAGQSSHFRPFPSTGAPQSKSSLPSPNVAWTSFQAGCSQAFEKVARAKAPKSFISLSDRLSCTFLAVSQFVLYPTSVMSMHFLIPQSDSTAPLSVLNNA